MYDTDANCLQVHLVTQDDSQVEMLHSSQTHLKGVESTGSVIKVRRLPDNILCLYRPCLQFVEEIFAIFKYNFLTYLHYEYHNYGVSYCLN